MSPVMRIPGAQLTQLVWCCTKCGKDDGWARANVPLGDALDDEAARRTLLDECTRKVLDYHRSIDGCEATADHIFYHRQKADTAPERMH